YSAGWFPPGNQTLPVGASSKDGRGTWSDESPWYKEARRGRRVPSGHRNGPNRLGYRGAAGGFRIRRGIAAFSPAAKDDSSPTRPPWGLRVTACSPAYSSPNALAALGKAVKGLPGLPQLQIQC